MSDWQRLQALDPGKGDRGASDYEIYLNFSLIFHAWELIIRGLRRSSVVASPEEIQPHRLDLVSGERDLARSPIARERFERLLSPNSADSPFQGVREVLAISPVTEVARRP